MTAIVVETALRGLLFAALVGACLAALRVRHVPSRKAAWTVVLLASLAMPALLRWPLLAGLRTRLAWVAPIPVAASAPAPSVPKPAATSPAASSDTSFAALSNASETLPHAASRAVRRRKHAASALTPDAAPAPAPLSQDRTVLSSAASPARRFAWPSLFPALAWLYCAVAAALLFRLLLGLAAAVRLWRAAQPVSPLYAPQGNVRASARIASPVTIGSGIVLPADYQHWDRRRLRMVLAHEQSHVRQMDFYLQFLAGLYAALFWFSPLGWWLRHALSRLGEAISDRAGLNAAGSTAQYAQIVLEFAAMPRRNAPGVAMARRANLSRRIDALLSEGWVHNAFAAGRRRALLSLLAIPAALFAATALVRIPAASAQTAPVAPPPTTAGPKNGIPSGVVARGPQSGVPSHGPQSAPQGIGPAQAPDPSLAPPAGQAVPGGGPSAGITAGPDLQTAPPPPPPPPDTGETVIPASSAAPPHLPAPPEPPAPQASPDAATAGQSGGSTTLHHDRDGSRDFDYHAAPNGDAWALASGTWRDSDVAGLTPSRRAELERAHRQAHGPFLWFTRAGKSYIVTDPVEIARIEGMCQAISDLGRQQRDLGREQGQLAREQYHVDVKLPDMAQLQAQIRSAMAEAEAQQKQWITAETQARIDEQLKDAEKELSPQKMAELQARIKAAENAWSAQKQADLDAKLAEAQKQIEEAQRHLAGEQSLWAAKMGEAQGKLGEVQGRLGEAQARLSQGIDREVQRVIQESLTNGRAVPVQ